VEIATGGSQAFRHPLAHKRGFIIEQAEQGIDLSGTQSGGQGFEI